MSSRGVHEFHSNQCLLLFSLRQLPQQARLLLKQTEELYHNLLPPFKNPSLEVASPSSCKLKCLANCQIREPETMFLVEEFIPVIELLFAYHSVLVGVDLSLLVTEASVFASWESARVLPQTRSTSVSNYEQGHQSDESSVNNEENKDQGQRQTTKEEVPSLN